MEITDAHRIQYSGACWSVLDVVAGGAASRRDPLRYPFPAWMVVSNVLQSEKSHFLRSVLAKILH